MRQRPHSVLIVEDEGLVSLMLEDILREMGACKVDVFASASEALAAAGSRDYDCAVLDVIVRDGMCTRVADVLEQRGIPFIFSSGVGIDALEPRHRTRSLISKPFDDASLKNHILSLLAGNGDPVAA
jgi:CheY-like chemotaxis protein